MKLLNMSTRFYGLSPVVKLQGRIQRGLRGEGVKPLFPNRRGSIISYNFTRKEKISNAIHNCYQENPLFQKFLDPALNSRLKRITVLQEKDTVYSKVKKFVELDACMYTASEKNFKCYGMSVMNCIVQYDTKYK